MTHDQECTFDKTLCRDCQLQQHARADERERSATRIATMPVHRINGHLYVNYDAAIAAAKGTK